MERANVFKSQLLFWWYLAITVAYLNVWHTVRTRTLLQMLFHAYHQSYIRMIILSSGWYTMRTQWNTVQLHRSGIDQSVFVLPKLTFVHVHTHTHTHTHHMIIYIHTVKLIWINKVLVWFHYDDLVFDKLHILLSFITILNAVTIMKFPVGYISNIMTLCEHLYMLFLEQRFYYFSFCPV